MTEEKRPPKGTPEYEAWRKIRAQKRAKELLSSEAEFDQNGLLSGSKEAMRDTNVDSEPDLKVIKRD
jgi:hypothetical protein